MFAGIVIEIFPKLAVLGKVPIFTGLAKLPAASLNCAVYTFPAVKVPVLLNGNVAVAPAQKGPTKFPAVMVLAEAGLVSCILVTAKEGSIPTPSLSFTHLKPILTFGLLSADAGSAIFGDAVQKP